MKKFLTLFGSLSLAISASLPVTSCSSPNKSKTPTKPGTDPESGKAYSNLLVENNIKDFFSARKFLAKKFNLQLDEFTMTWTSSQTVRLVPMPGTSLRNTMTSLVDYRLDSGYNSISKNDSLSTLKDECPLTQVELKIPYIESLEKNAKTDIDKQTLADDYFNVLKYMSGKEMDANIYTYSYKNASDLSNPNLKGILTVVNKNDSTDTIDVNVEKNAIPVDEFFDCDDIYNIYLPEAMTNITKDDFSALGGASTTGGPFQAYMNYYFATGNYANNFYGYYKDDIVDLFSGIMGLGGDNSGISIKKTLDSSGKAGVLNFTLKNIDNYKNDSGLISSDGEGNIFNININFTTVMPDTDEYDYYARYIIQKDANGKEQTNLWEVKENTLNNLGHPVTGIKDLTSDKKSKDAFSKTNIGKDYLTEYEFDDFKLKNSTESNIDIKKEFVNKLNSITGSKLDFGVFLDDEISLISNNDGYLYLAPKFGSRIMDIVQRDAMVKNVTIFGMDMTVPLVPQFQKTIGSYVFRIDVQNN
ncbi:hypothetical protein [Spiroplasma endosymbiont of Aspidapion aeneum]|uniref:hypothetical protein n=1 Tax=Spiroplasma endosymbiont of Aspidapion aeneum TaxID=3066276 RepID=UPI00313D3C93